MVCDAAELTDGVRSAISGQRYYSPSLGRFINKDPIEESGGINLYGFCGNNGVNRWDYLGNISQDYYHNNNPMNPDNWYMDGISFDDGHVTVSAGSAGYNPGTNGFVSTAGAAFTHVSEGKKSETHVTTPGGEGYTIKLGVLEVLEYDTKGFAPNTTPTGMLISATGPVERLDKNSGAREALQKFFGDGNPEHLKNVPRSELEKTQRNAERAVDKGLGGDDHIRKMQDRADKLNDVLKGRDQPSPALPWWAPVAPFLNWGIPIFIPPNTIPKKLDPNNGPTIVAYLNNNERFRLV